MEKCPYCDADLESGTLYSYRAAYFLPDGKSIAWITESALKKKGGIMLRSPAIFSGDSYPKAYVCRQCKKITIPYWG